MIPLPGPTCDDKQPSLSRRCVWRSHVPIKELSTPTTQLALRSGCYVYNCVEYVRVIRGPTGVLEVERFLSALERWGGICMIRDRTVSLTLYAGPGPRGRLGRVRKILTIL